MELNEEIGNDPYRFIRGGGEMGTRTRSFDWAATSIGSPEGWPQSLRLTLSMILSSKFPMFLWWGDDLIQFYNDAYRPSLGNNGKHPLALGQKGKDCWPEIWEIIYPLIQQVRNTEEATWSEDQLIPIYRNGRLEDVYWTFGYSPIVGDSGRVDGVLVVCTETTEKVQTRKALEESEQRFRTMAEGTGILISVADADLNTIYFNEAWEKFTGRSMASLLNFGWKDIIHPDDKEQFQRNYKKAVEKNESFSSEFRVLNKDGKYHWLLANIPARYNADGSHVGYISSCIDITALKETEQKMQDNEHQMRTMIETAPFAIGVYIGREMRVEFANQSILDIWGKGNNVIGKPFREVLPELDNQEVFQQLDTVFITGTAFHTQNQRLDLVKDNEARPYYFNYSLTPLFDREGSVYGVMNTGVDLTELNLARMAIQKSEENLRNTILQAPVAMCILTGPLHVVEIANDMMIELWGKPVQTIMNKPIFEGLPDAREQGLEKLLADVYTTGETFKANDMPVVLLRNGALETVYQNFVYEPYRDGDGSILGILAITIDVTEQVLARQKIEETVAERTRELATANYSLQKSNADLAQFAFIASHDLQEPVRKVSTFTQMLEKHLGQTDERAENYINKIKKSSSRMLLLIRDVLTYSELSATHREYAMVDLQAIVADVVTDFELLIEQKNASIRVQGLPEIEAIPLHMSQLFGNLISNALKFTRPGIQATIDITASKMTKQELESHPSLDKKENYYRIHVKDNGIGFQQEYASQIFSIFQRLHGKAEYEGTGIGLAMCQKIVQNHNGEIYALSTPGEGSSFILALPARQKARYPAGL